MSSLLHNVMSSPEDIAFQKSVRDMQRRENDLRNEQWKLNRNWEETQKAGSWGKSIQLGSYRAMQEYNRSCQQGKCKHPNHHVQRDLDRSAEISGELKALKTDHENLLKAENTRKIQLIETAHKQHRAKLAADIKIAKRKANHPANTTTRPPSRRHKSGARSRYVPPPRRSSRR